MIGGTFAASHPDRIGRAVLMNCTASAAGSRQKLEYGFLLRVAKLLGGIRPPLTRSVLKAFLGPTTFTTRPDVVAFVRDTVQAADIRSCAWAVKSVVPARPDQRAANRDPEFIDSPEPLDIRRGAPGHLAFGHGVHHCLGGPLARMEMRIAFPALLRRFPTLALAEEFDDVAFRSFHFIYGLKSLSVKW